MTMGATGMLGNFEGFDSTFGHWWVDDEGAWNFWGLDRPNDPEDRERAEQSFRRFALHRLGMVQVTLRPGKAAVEFDLHRADDTALDATVDFFAATACPGGTELRFFHQAWNIERHRSAAALARRIDEVRNFRDAVLANTVTTLKRPLSARAMVSPRVRDALRLAEARASKLTLLDCAELIPHLIIYRREDRLGLGKWVSLYAGSQSGGAWVFGQDWVREARGRPYQIDPPGRQYSFNVMKPYAGRYRRTPAGPYPRDHAPPRQGPALGALRTPAVPGRHRRRRTRPLLPVGSYSGHRDPVHAGVRMKSIRS